VIVKNRPGIAEGGLIVRIPGREILQHADQAPSQHQAHPNNHQQGNHDSHGTSPDLNVSASLKFRHFQGCRNKADKNVRAARRQRRKLRHLADAA
jgi:hypothetical protein